MCVCRCVTAFIQLNSINNDVKLKTKCFCIVVLIVLFLHQLCFSYVKKHVIFSEQTGPHVYPHCLKMDTCRTKAVPHWVSSRKKVKSLTASWVKEFLKISIFRIAVVQETLMYYLY